MQTNSKIAVLGVASPYNVANRFLDEISSALSSSGHAVLRFGHAKELEQVVAFEPDWILSINGTALDVEVASAPLPTALGAAHLSLFVDNPLLFPWRFEHAGRGCFTVADPNVAGQVALNWPDVGPVYYLPHGASGPSLPFDAKERTIRVLFPGSYEDPDELRESWKRYPQAAQDWLEERGDTLAFSSAARPFLACEEVDRSSLYALACGQMVQQDLERFINMRRRYELLRSLTQAGVSVTLAGTGWERHPDASYHQRVGPRSFAQVIELFQRSEVVLHTAVTADSHERPLTAMLQGAAVATYCNDFWRTHFKDNEEVFLYFLEEIQTVGQRIASILADSVSLGAVQRQGQELVAKQHTWQHRAQKLPISGFLR